MDYNQVTKDIFTDHSSVNKLLDDYNFYTSEIERKNNLYIAAGFVPLIVFMTVGFINEFYHHLAFLWLAYICIALFFMMSLFLAFNTTTHQEFSKLRQLDLMLGDKLQESEFIKDISKLAIDKDCEILVSEITESPDRVMILSALIGRNFHNRNILVV
jgi:hypothetical protein